MTVSRSVKARPRKTRLVGVVASLADLERATRLRRPPDLFEIRLDALHPVAPSTERLLATLRRPLIITARHPREGGQNNLPAAQRRQLLLRFLPLAAYLDVELRALPYLTAILQAAAERDLPRILSVHLLQQTPSLPALRRFVAQAAEFSPAFVKIVTRTDTAADLARLLNFFDERPHPLPLALMGIGRLGRKSRIALAQRGSLLQYVHLGSAVVSGQLSLADAQRLTSFR